MVREGFWEKTMFLNIDDNRDLAAWGEREDKEIMKEKVGKKMAG